MAFGGYRCRASVSINHSVGVDAKTHLKPVAVILQLEPTTHQRCQAPREGEAKSFLGGETFASQEIEQVRVAGEAVFDPVRAKLSNSAKGEGARVGDTDQVRETVDSHRFGLGFHKTLVRGKKTHGCRRAFDGRGSDSVWRQATMPDRINDQLLTKPLSIARPPGFGQPLDHSTNHLLDDGGEVSLREVFVDGIDAMNLRLSCAVLVAAPHYPHTWEAVEHRRVAESDEARDGGVSVRVGNARITKRFPVIGVKANSRKQTTVEVRTPPSRDGPKLELTLTGAVPYFVNLFLRGTDDPSVIVQIGPGLTGGPPLVVGAVPTRGSNNSKGCNRPSAMNAHVDRGRLDLSFGVMDTSLEVGG